MKISYKREMNHNYMIVECEGDRSGYAEKMMAGNRIEGLLKFRVKLVDNEKFYYYEITSRQPLSRLLSSHSLRTPEISRLILGISQVLEKIDAFLLNEEQILLDPEYIYMDPETDELGLCLIPGYHGDFPSSLTKLLQYLLGKVDHQDKESVVLAYGLFQESQKENYGMKDLLKLLFPVNCRNDTAPQQEERVPEQKREEDKKEEVRPLSLNKDAAAPKQKKKVWYQLLFLPLRIFGLYAWGGWDELYNKWIWVAAIEIVIAVFTALMWNKKTEPEQKEKVLFQKMPPSESWHMDFEEEAREESCDESLQKAVFSTGYKEENTVLLAETEKKDGFHKLISLQPESSDILIEYYPFIIGKQEGIVDYVLPKDTVSRLHVRLDEQEGRYMLTDLNSTNGTVVNGVLLDNNACVELSSGDEVYIADAAYRFL